MAKRSEKNDISELSFEQAIDKLRSIVEHIERGEVPLQESIDQYETGMELIKHCRAILLGAERKIEKISAEQAEDELANEAEGEYEGDGKDEEDEQEGLF